MRPIIYKVFRYAGAGLDEIRIRIFSTLFYCKGGFSFKLFLLTLLKPDIFGWWVIKCPRLIIPEPLGILLQNSVLL